MIASGLRKRAYLRIAAAFVIAACVFFVMSSPRSTAEDGFSLPEPDYYGVKPIYSIPATAVRQGDYLEIVVEFNVVPNSHVYRDSVVFTYTTIQGARVAGVVFPDATESDDASGKRDIFRGSFVVRQILQAVGKPGESIVLQGGVDMQGCQDNGQCYLPKTVNIDLKLKILEPLPDSHQDIGETTQPQTQKPSQPAQSAAPAQGGGASGGGLRIADFLLAFITGILLSFSPCVLPMLPVTSGIILSYSKPGRLNAFIASIIYVLGLSVVFAVVGCVIAFVGGSVQSVINSIYVRAFIALIFVALSLSMFGLYQIGLPSSVTTKMQDLGQKTRKNLIGLFALGMLSALIVSPCGGPIILAVLVRIGEIGSISIGFLMMILLAWGMGLLLVAAGTFPNLVPRSGMWMEKVKVIFGFLLLWGALYYISPYIAEGVYYIGIALLAVFGSVFLGCWDGITAESGLAQRILRAVGILLILMAIFFGFQGVAELTGAGFTGSQSAAEKVDPLTNGDEANVAAAIGAGKPVLLDFWAKWCAYCNDLDKYTYSDPRVVAELARFRAFRIDFDKQHALNDKYAVKLPPKVVIIDSDGKIREDLSFTGFKNADELLAILKQVK